MRRIPYMLAPVLLGACSLMGLDDFRTPTCEQNTQCAPLNVQAGIAEDACRLYQCDERGSCVLSPRDWDGDGVPAAYCAAELEECSAGQCVDCDDDNPAAGNFTEICDGEDNDCDQIVDNGVTEMPMLADAVRGVDGIAPDIDTSGADARGRVHYGKRLEPNGIGLSYAREVGAGFSAVLEAPGQAPPPSQSLVYTRAMTLDPSGFNTPNITDGCPLAVSQRPPPPSGMVVMPDPMRCTTHAECDDGVFCNGYETCEPASPMSDPATGCRNAMGAAGRTPPCSVGEVCNEGTRLCQNVSPGNCLLADLASAELAPAEWLAATITTSGCAAGQLKIGYHTERMRTDDGADPGPSVLLRGDGARSTSYLGIDLDESGCTGGSRPMGEAVGVTSVNVAALPADPGRDTPRLRGQGLVAWLAAPFCHGSPDSTEREMCADSPASTAVEVVGVWHEQGSAGGVDVGWINATNNGLPQRLTEPAHGHGRPAVLSVDHARWSGFVVAYGRAGGGIALQAVSAFADPADVSEFEPYRSTVMTGTRRTTDPIADLGSAVVVDGGGGTTAEADHVRIVGTELADDRLLLALAWTEANGVWFSTVELSTASGSAAIAEGGWAPVELGAGTGFGPPTVGYSPEGMRTPAPDGSDDALGGWYVVWRTPTHILGRRVAESDYALIDTGPFVLSGDGNLSNPGAVTLMVQPGSAVDGMPDMMPDLGPVPRPRVLVHDLSEGGNFKMFSAVCGPLL